MAITFNPLSGQFENTQAVKAELFVTTKAKGNITTLAQALVDPATNAGAWYTIGVTGTLSGTNSGAVAVTARNYFVSSGGAWVEVANANKLATTAEAQNGVASTILTAETGKDAIDFDTDILYARRNWVSAAVELSQLSLSAKLLPRDSGVTTAAQSTNTITLSGGSETLTVEDIGRLIVWDSGAVAQITAVASTTSATALQSQTVAGGEFRVQAKPLTFVTFGDSVSEDDWSPIRMQLTRAYGFGGVFVTPAESPNPSRTYGGAGYTGTAGTATGGWTFAPGGRYYNVPSGSSVSVGISSLVAGNQFDLPVNERQSDRVTVIYRRAAGATTLSVQRKRSWELGWTDVETGIDATAGSGTLVAKSYTHALGAGWTYRINTTAGADAQIIGVLFLNLTVPGLVYCPAFSMGGSDVTQHVQFPADAVKTIVDAIMPDAVAFQILDVLADLEAELSNLQDLWDGQATKTDWWFMGGFAGSDGFGAAQAAFIKQHAIDYGKLYIANNPVSKTYAIATALGWHRDSIHHSGKGSAAFSEWQARILRLMDSSSAKIGRPIKSSVVEGNVILSNGRNLSDDIAQARVASHRLATGILPNGANSHGWADCPAIGTGDFTVQMLVKIPSSAASPGSSVRITGTRTNGNVNGMLNIGIEPATNGRVKLLWRSGSGVNTEFLTNFVLFAVLGKTLMLTVRMNRSTGIYDLYLDTEYANITRPPGPYGVTTDLPAVWDLTGTNFGILSGNSGPLEFYALGLFQSALSDAEIVANVAAGGPTTTVPSNWYSFREGAGLDTYDDSGNGRTFNQQSGPFVWLNPKVVQKTITAGATTGARTIHQLAGTVNFAAAATSVVVTNSLVTAASLVQVFVRTNDSTMKSAVAVAGAGSFTIHANAAATAETSVGFRVIE